MKDSEATHLFETVDHLDDRFVGQLAKGGHRFQKVHILLLFDQTRLDHDGLETMTINGPQTTIFDRFQRCCTRAIVQNGQLSEQLAGAHRVQIFAFLADLHSSLFHHVDDRTDVLFSNDHRLASIADGVHAVRDLTYLYWFQIFHELVVQNGVGDQLAYSVHRSTGDDSTVEKQRKGKRSKGDDDNEENNGGNNRIGRTKQQLNIQICGKS